MRLRSLVWNAAERRPRAPIRFPLTAIVLAALFGGWVLLFAPTLGGGDSRLLQQLTALAVTALPGVAVLLAAPTVDRRTLSDLGLGIDADWAIDFVFGLVLGAALVTVVFVVALAAGWVRVVGLFAQGPVPRGRSFAAGFATLTAFFLVVGFSEELVARGYVLTNAAEGLSGYLPRRQAVGLAVLVSSLLFGLVHLRNPNATLLSTVGISLAGVLLAAGYVLTGDLAIPIGIHVTWNLSLGGVYGFAVSGVGVGTTVVGTVETGPDLITGGAFGPEAGLLGVGAVLAGIACTVAYVRLRYGEVRVASGLTSLEHQ